MMKQFNHHLVYKITNLINGRIYIGVHKTNNVNDRYMGSGAELKRDIKKYGKDVFAKEILASFDTPSAMYNMESVLVNKEFIDREDTYNRIEGGLNTIELVNENIDRYRTPSDRKEWAKLGRKHANRQKAHLKGSHKHQYLLQTDPEYKAAFIAAVREGRSTSNCGFKGQKHTEEAKRKIGEANSRLLKGAGNPNYGKKWIYDPASGETRSVKKEELEKLILEGWKVGRCPR